jgi:myo-inositol-1-phosphate synthase
MLYAYAALTSRIPFINGSSHCTVDTPAMEALAQKHQVAICGKDFKAGHILMKTILAPGLKARMLGLTGWYSTDVQGPQEEVAPEDKGSSAAEEESQLSALKTILQPDVYPDLYGDFHHKVVISQNPPGGDEKEGRDHVDVFSWMGYPAQIKINFSCHESLLTAPLVLDLILFMDLAARADMIGIQEWLSFYFKTPQCASELYSEHDLFIQLMKLKNTLRYLMGQEQITHLGLDYYYAI